MAEPNYAGNIIVNLASLPDFLRKPILKKRMMEFFSLSKPEREEMIYNALDAGPTIPFANFAKLFKTWLEVLTTITEEERLILFSSYIHQILSTPEKLINFNLDGILEIFISLEHSQKEILKNSIDNVVSGLDDVRKKKFFVIIPENAKAQLEI